MKIATWNVNSIRPRLEQVCEWLKTAAPEIVVLQEIKVVSELFPRSDFEDLGYNVAVHGQKTYNGVALLSKFPIDDVTCGIPGDIPGYEEDAQARYINAFTGGLRIASVYVPNGQEPGSDKFRYKLEFCKALAQHIQNLGQQDEPLIIAGDYNITFDDQDVCDPEAWREQILCSQDERQALRTIINAGVYDALETMQKRSFTWWDYRQGAFQKDQGMRIDHILASPHVIDRLQDAGVDRDVRGLPQPSDHAPVWCKLRA